MTTSAEVRSDLVDALRLDLVGPRPGEPGHARYREEILPIAPSKWYLTGFLVPYEAPIDQRSDDDGDDSLDQQSRVVDGDDDNAPEQTSARRAYFPSSMGLSVLVPEDAAQLQVKITWGDYAPVSHDDEALEAATDGEEGDGEAGERRRRDCRRAPREAELVVPLRESAEPRKSEVPGGGGLQVVVSVRKTSSLAAAPASASPSCAPRPSSRPPGDPSSSPSCS